MWTSMFEALIKSQTISKFHPDSFLGVKKRTCPRKRGRLVYRKPVGLLPVPVRKRLGGVILVVSVCERVNGVNSVGLSSRQHGVEQSINHALDQHSFHFLSSLKCPLKGRFNRVFASLSRSSSQTIVFFWESKTLLHGLKRLCNSARLSVFNLTNDTSFSQTCFSG